MQIEHEVPAPGNCVGCGDDLGTGEGLCGACIMAETSKKN